MCSTGVCKLLTCSVVPGVALSEQSSVSGVGVATEIKVASFVDRQLAAVDIKLQPVVGAEVETSVQTGFCYFVHKKMSEIRVLHSTLDRMINLFSRYGPKKLETAVGRAPLCFCHLHMIWTGLLSMSFVKMVTMCGR